MYRQPMHSPHRGSRNRFPLGPILVGLLVVLAIGGGYGWYRSRAEAEPPPAEKPQATPAEVLGHPVTATLDLDSQRMLAAGPPTARGREVALLSRQPDGELTVHKRLVLALPGSSLTLRRQALPGYPDAVVVQTQREHGEPQYAAVAVTGQSLEPLDYYRLTAPPAPEPEGTAILVDKHLNVLYLYEAGELVKSYRVATGEQFVGSRPTWEDWQTNFYTPEGRFTIDLKWENPVFYGDDNHPPAEGGAPDNPLGTRWLGFKVLGEGDPATIWGIHGTNEPESIGTWASDGCIRLHTPEVEELFDRVPEGTPLYIVGETGAGEA